MYADRRDRELGGGIELGAEDNRGKRGCWEGRFKGNDGRSIAESIVLV